MADAIYSSFRIEMNAFANGLDAVIRNSAYDWELKVQESDTYSKFNNICTCLKNMDEYFNIIYNYLKNENETLDETIFRYLGITPNRIKIMFMKGKQELARKIGRVIARNQLSESKHMLF